MTTAELLRKVRYLELKALRASRLLGSGRFHSAFKGAGVAFSEVRPYQYGDDVRHIDWNVSARAGKPYVKRFEEEKELSITLMTDLSGSTDFGLVQATKRDFQNEIAAILAFSALQNNDRVALLGFSNQLEYYLPPGRGRAQLLRILQALVAHVPRSNGTNISHALEQLNRLAPKSSAVFLLSDFDDRDYERTLQLSALRYDVTGVMVYDPVERLLPDAGMIRALDAETGRAFWIDAISPEVRQSYHQQFLLRQRYFWQAFRQAGARAIQIASQERPEVRLAAFFAGRLSNFLAK